jgi:hypothetical protein
VNFLHDICVTSIWFQNSCMMTGLSSVVYFLWTVLFWDWLLSIGIKNNFSPECLILMLLLLNLTLYINQIWK